MLDSLRNPLRKARPDSVLNNLPPGDQRRILDWLASHTYMNVIQKIAAPAPEGLGLKVHYTSLRRFWQRHLATELRAQRADLAHLRSFSPATSEQRSAPYPALTREALERYAFHLALNPGANPDVLLKLNHFLLRLQHHDITAQKFAWELKNRTAVAQAKARAAAPAPETADSLAAGQRLEQIDTFFIKLLKEACTPPQAAPTKPLTNPGAC